MQDEDGVALFVLVHLPQPPSGSHRLATRVHPFFLHDLDELRMTTILAGSDVLHAHALKAQEAEVRPKLGAALKVEIDRTLGARHGLSWLRGWGK